jgi:hypothetical protein
MQWTRDATKSEGQTFPRGEEVLVKFLESPKVPASTEKRVIYPVRVYISKDAQT